MRLRMLQCHCAFEGAEALSEPRPLRHSAIGNQGQGETRGFRRRTGEEAVDPASIELRRVAGYTPRIEPTCVRVAN